MDKIDTEAKFEGWGALTGEEKIISWMGDDPQHILMEIFLNNSRATEKVDKGTKNS